MRKCYAGGVARPSEVSSGDSQGKGQQTARLLREGALKAARAHVQAWMASSPKDAAAWEWMARVCVQDGKLQQALFYAQRATVVAAGSASAWMLVARLEGMTHQKSRRNEEVARTQGNQADQVDQVDQVGRADQVDQVGRVLAAAERAVALDAGLVEPYEIGAVALAGAGWFVKARSWCQRGLNISPGDEALRMILCTTYLETGRVELAVEGLSRLMEERGDQAHTADVLCHVLNYAPDVTPAFVRRMHLAYGRIVKRHRPEGLAGFDLSKHPRVIGERPLRVAVISPDLRDHSCGYFIGPLFEHHDRSRLRLFGYHTNLATDGVTERLASQAAGWRHVDRASDQALAELVRADGIDVAIDLAGHTRGESLVAMHLKASPVQVTYLGYPNITGLDAIDARLVDSHTDPTVLEPGNEDRPQGAERLVRMDPCFVCFQPGQTVAKVGPVPSLERGHVTFGSCNALQKINLRVLALWAAVLKAMPSARLLLKAHNLREEELRSEIRDRCGAMGIASERLELLGPMADKREHLEVYNRIDVALDPFPYNGTTTTCDALTMGVPVVTLAGQVHASRVGVSLLHAVGHPEWIASNAEEYVRLATMLAADEKGRERMRGFGASDGAAAVGLREEMRSSVLCDGRAFCERFTLAIEGLYLQRIEAAHARYAAASTPLDNT